MTPVCHPPCPRQEELRKSGAPRGFAASLRKHSILQNSQLRKEFDFTDVAKVLFHMTIFTKLILMLIVTTIIAIVCRRPRRSS